MELQITKITKEASKGQLLALADMDGSNIIEHGHSALELKIIIHKYQLYLDELKKRID